MADNKRGSILEQIIKYEDDFLAFEKQRNSRSQQQKIDGDNNIPSGVLIDSESVSEEEKNQDKSSDESKARDHNDNSGTPNNPYRDWNRWNINHIFKAWWNYKYGMSYQSWRNIQGFAGFLPLNTGGDDNKDRNYYTIGLLYKIMQIGTEYPNIMDLFYKYGREKKEFRITFRGAQLYELTINVVFDNGRFCIENVNFNFDVLQPAEKLINEKGNSKGDQAVSETPKRAPEALRFHISWDLDTQEDISLQTLVEPNDIPGINDSEILNYLTLRLETRNAKAAIMSRNMSHNIGSHVISYLHNEMIEYSLCDMVGICHGLESVIKNGETRERLKAINLLRKDPSNDRRVAFMNGVQFFLAYLQERQDYIALISTNIYMPPISANFKDEVYDVLNPDKKYLRHKSTVPKIDNLLLHYITKSEGISRPLLFDQDSKAKIGRDIVIRFGEFTGSELVHPDLERLRQLNVALPGGTLGRQALYSILENVMRNAAKHDAKSLGNKDLELAIECYDKTSWQTADDNGLKDVLNRFYVKNDDEEEYYYITLTINVCPALSDLERLREAIVEPFVQEHSMLETNKGIKEMRISAAWLRSEEEIVFPESFDPAPVPDFRLTGEEKMMTYQKQLGNHPPILYVRTDDNNHLQYIFCLLKKREIAYIVKNDTPDKKIPKFPDSWGWKTFKEKDYYLLGRNTFFATIVSEEVDFIKAAKYSGYRVFQESTLQYTKKIAGCKSEQDRQAILLEILRLSSKYKDGDQIWIGDASISCDENASQFVKIYSVEGNNCPNVPFIYHSHYDPLKKDYNSSGFIEEITGNNSTDRLLRHYHVKNNKSLLDLHWFYTHLLVAKSTVLLFDERLFDRMVAENNVKLGLANCDKNVHIFNLIDSGEGMIIVGMDIITSESGRRQIIQGECGSLQYDINTGELVLKSNIAFKKGDFVSVHQGLFDKIFDKWAIKEERKQIAMVRSLYKILCHQDEKYNEDFLIELNYCPGLTIHSGRSIPSRSSMPMDIPFLPFAAIERAVSDCKYTLIELLINAKPQYNRK